MELKCKLYNVDEKLPEFNYNVIVFLKYQPVSDIGYYSNNYWYIKDNDEYIRCDKYDLMIEYWMEFPTKFNI